jgi:phosphoserine phosphatase
LPPLPTVALFVSHIGVPLPSARAAALNFDKLGVEKGMEIRGELRRLRHPWSVLAFQIAGADGLRLLHPDGEDMERARPPAEPLMEELLRRPQAEGRATLVMTLIAGAAGRPSLPDIAVAIGRMLPYAAATVWLARGEACDLFFDAADAAAIEAEASAIIGGAAIDLVLQPAAGRKKRLLVADLESTIIENEMLDELAELLGIGPRVAEITRRAMNGEVDFVEALEARVALLGGFDCRVLERAAARIRVTAGASELVATMRRDGAATAVVSGGFTVFAERVAQALGFDHVVANRLDIVAGRIAGTMPMPIVTDETKCQTLLALATRYGISPAQTLAIGDGANDLAMLAAAGLGVAFHAKPAVAAAARHRLDHADLGGLLYAQGYAKNEIAA